MAKSEDDNIPLHYLVTNDPMTREDVGTTQHEYFKVLLRMLQGQRTQVNTQNKYGETALHKAAWKGSIKSVEYLVKFSTIDINLQNTKGETGLCYAVRRPDSASRLPLVRLLISLGADPAIQGVFGSPLDIAKQAGHEDVVALLASRAEKEPSKMEENRGAEKETAVRSILNVTAKKSRPNKPLGLLRQEGSGSVQKVFIMARDGRFLAAKPSGEIVLAARNLSLAPSVQTPECRLWQTWTIVLLPPSSGWEDEGGSMVGVLSWQGTYLRAYPDGNLFSEKGVVQDLDSFRMPHFRPNVVAFKAHHGRYLSAISGRPRAAGATRDKWEAWTLHYVDDSDVMRDWYGYAISGETAEAYRNFAYRYYNERLPQARREWNKGLASGSLDKELFQDTPTIRRLIIAGVPPEIKSEVWAKLSGVEGKARVSTSSYADIKRSELLAGEAARDNIMSDIDRRLQGHAFLCKPSSRTALRRLISSYIVWDPLTPYSSYWAPIAGLLLVVCSEEEAFWLLAKLVGDLAKDYYSPSKAALVVDIHIIERLLQATEPEVIKNLHRLNLGMTDVVDTWLLSLFTCFSKDLCLRIWDILFSDGPLCLVAVAYSIIRLYSHDLSSATQPYTLFARLTTLLAAPIDPDIIVKMVTEDFPKDITSREINLTLTKQRLWTMHIDELAQNLKREDFQALSQLYETEELEQMYSAYRHIIGEPDFPEGLHDHQWPLFLQQILPERPAVMVVKPAFVQRLFLLLGPQHTGVLNFQSVATGIRALLKGPLPDTLALFFDTWTTCTDGQRYLSLEMLPKVIESLWSVYPAPFPASDDESDGSDSEGEEDMGTVVGDHNESQNEKTNAKSGVDAGPLDYHSFVLYVGTHHPSLVASITAQLIL
eukprot:TRINITY_DN6210_c0_g1_i3.p1 TRINITY_DN6210_c0_g1~~TRINITY_DN6210_c0_g1_i3.p1  ORF type:complete len:880 (+),score=94.32 TRINITY_DN6210_c0_g1_i3:189-2828(+)